MQNHSTLKKLFPILIFIFWCFKSYGQQAPTFTSSPVTSVGDTETYTYTITTEDLDGDIVNVSSTSLPGFLSLAQSRPVSTLAGTGIAGFTDNMNAALAQFNQPGGIDFDAQGNMIVADQMNHRIRLIDAITGEVTTLAGTGVAGFADAADPLMAQFNQPSAVKVDAQGNVLVADQANHRIRHIDAMTGEVTTLAGSGSSGFSNDADPLLARFNSPTDLAIDALGNVIVADAGNHLIRRIDAGTGEVSTLAGNSITTFGGFLDDVNPLVAQFDQPEGIVIDADGNVLVADRFNSRIRRIDGATGAVTTFAGTGDFFGNPENPDPLLAVFIAPRRLTIDSRGNIFVTDFDRVARIDGSTLKVTTYAGSGLGFADNADPLKAKFNLPVGIAVDTAGNIVIADQMNNRIRHMGAGPYILTGDATGQAGTYNITLTADDISGNSTDQSFSITVNDITAPVISSTNVMGIVEHVSGVAYSVAATDNNVSNTIINFALGSGNDEGFFSLSGNEISFINPPDFENPLDGDGDNRYNISITVTDGTGNTSSPFIATIVVINSNDAPAFTSAPVTSVNDNESYTYTITAADAVALNGSDLPAFLSIQQISSGVGTFAGSGVNGLADNTDPLIAQLSAASGIAIDTEGNVFIADSPNNVIRRIDRITGEVSTLAGTGVFGFKDNSDPLLAQFASPSGIAIDAGDNIFISDTDNDRIRRIDGVTGEVTTIAGTGASSFADNTDPLLARFTSPAGIVVDRQGNLLIADGSRIRRIDGVTRAVSTFAGAASGYADNADPLLARFRGTRGLTMDSQGNLFVTDQSDNRIRRVDGSTGEVTTLAGTGAFGFMDNEDPSLAQFFLPFGIAVDAEGNILVTDLVNSRIRRIDANTGAVTTLAGSSAGYNDDTDLSQALFSGPSGIAVDSQGNVFIGDNGNRRIRIIDAGKLQLTGDATGQAGTYSISLAANDGNGNVTMQDFTLTVNDVTAPVFSSGNTAGFSENETGVAYTATATDSNVNNTTITFTLGSDNDESLFSVSGNEISFISPPDFENPQDIGGDNDYVIEVIAADEAGNTITLTVTISVSDANDAPTFTSTPVTSVNDNESYLYAITTNDLEGDDVTISSDNLPGFLSLDQTVPGIADISGNATGQAGTYSITLTADDGNGNMTDQSFNLTINDATGPVFNSGSTASFAENSSDIVYTAAATDNNANNTTITYTLGIDNDEDFFSIAGNEVSFITPPDFEVPQDINGDNDYVVELIATDDADNATPFFVSITVTDVNEAPVVVNALQNIVVDEDFAEQTVSLNGIFSDEDGDQLTLTATSSNENVITVSIDQGTEMLTITEVGNGTADITITASDGNGGQASDVFAVTVNNVNDAPVVVNALQDITVNEDFAEQTVSLNGVFSDEDGDELTITASSSDENVVTVSINANTQLLTITEVGNGTADVTITANDGNGGQAIDTFVVTVNNVNDAPVVANALQDIVVNEDFAEQTVSLNGLFSDEDGDQLTLTATSSNENVITVSINANTQLLTITEVGNGTADITITVSDGNGGQASDVFVVTVNNVNDAPVVTNALQDIVVDEDFAMQTVSLNGVFSDEDGDQLTLMTSSSDETVVTVSIDQGTEMLTITEVGNGTADVTITANDGNGGQASDVFVVTVNNVNDAPVVTNALQDIVVDEDFAMQTVSLNGVFSDEDGDQLTLTATSSNEEAVTVSIDQGTEMLTITEIANGTADVTITANDGNGGQVSDTFAFTTEASIVVSVSEDLYEELEVFPNPSAEWIRLKLSTGRFEQTRVSLVDLHGKEVQVLINRSLQNIVQDFNISNLKAGVYILVVNRNNQLVTRKLIKN